MAESGHRSYTAYTEAQTVQSRQYQPNRIPPIAGRTFGHSHEMLPTQPVGPPRPTYPHPFEPFHSAGPAPAPQYWGPPPPGWYIQPRTRPVRAAQACDSCRQRKAKCDEGRPDCSHCKENGLKCIYRDVPPQKSEKQTMAIHELFDSVDERVKDLVRAFSKQEESINRQEDSISQQGDAIDRLVKKHEKMNSKLQSLVDRMSNQVSGYQNINEPFM